MTKKGYMHIIVLADFYNQLKQFAQLEGLSISKLIERQFSINTNINTNQENASNTIIKPFSKEAQNDSCFLNISSVSASSQEGLFVPRERFGHEFTGKTLCYLRINKNISSEIGKFYI